LGYSIDDDTMVFTWTKLELKPCPAVKKLDILSKLMEGLDLLRKLNEEDDDVVVIRHVANAYYERCGWNYKRLLKRCR